MSDKEEQDLRWKLASILGEVFSSDALDKARNKVRDVADQLVSDFEYSIQSDASYNLSYYVQRMAEDAIKAMLAGDDATMRKYLMCQQGGYTGRDREHPVIRGTLFETGAVELRHKIVYAHAELLKNERILDLEDQVRSLVEQVTRLEKRYEELIRERAF